MQHSLQQGLDIEPAAMTQELDVQVVVTKDRFLDVEDLVEDELLLQLPGQVCIDLDCERRPPLQFGGLASEVGGPAVTSATLAKNGQGKTLSGDEPESGEKDIEQQKSEDNPFAILRSLKLQNNSEK